MERINPDLSLSLEETQSFNPHFGQSTPKKGNQTCASTSAISLDISALSFSQLEGDPKHRPLQKRVQFRKQSGPAKKRLKPTLVCKFCGKGYICTPSFKTHVLNHQVQDVASRYLDRDHILNALDDIALNTIQKVAKAPAPGEGGTLLKGLINFLIFTAANCGKWKTFNKELCNLMLNNAVGVKFLLPSKLLNVLTDEVEDILSNPETQFFLLNFLDLPIEYDNYVKSQFLVEYVIAFMQCILTFISSKVCGEKETFEKDVNLSQDEREVVYYVGGSIMRGYIRIAYRYKDSKKWKAIMEAIEKNALTDQPVGDSNWTASVDRGGLLYLTRQCQDFFLELTKIVYSSEGLDGSVNFQEVIKKASSSYVPVMWDNMIAECVSEEVSLNFMNDVIKSYCRTCGRGIIKRRLNNLRRGPLISMPTRHKVASRKSS